MKTTKVTFFGHRDVCDPNVEDRLYKIICNLINKHQYVEFLVGRNGNFDQMASCAIHRAQRMIRDDNNSHILWLPYSTAEYRNNVKAFEDYYDEVRIIKWGGSFKSAFYLRNKAMIDLCDILICYVTNPQGGAATHALCKN